MADRWHVGFVDIGGRQGMLGQVEGRTGDDVAYWLAMRTPAWRDRIRYVAIDMCTVFVSAIRRYLPDATIVVDHFHIVKLANDTVAEVRRRIATQLRGRRGRATDPEYQVRNLLRRNREDLTGKAFTRLWDTLVDLDEESRVSWRPGYPACSRSRGLMSRSLSRSCRGRYRPWGSRTVCSVGWFSGSRSSPL